MLFEYLHSLHIKEITHQDIFKRNRKIMYFHLQIYYNYLQIFKDNYSLNGHNC
jgi:hypothetical protein